MPPYDLPEICARCGLKPGKSFWEVNNEVARIDPLSIISVWFGHIRVQKRKYFFSVPVCESCRVVLRNSQKASSRAKWIGVIFGILSLGFYALFRKNHNEENVVLLACITILFGGLIGFGLGNIVSGIIKTLNNVSIGSYDGQYFKFKNREFHRQFEAINPLLVKK